MALTNSRPLNLLDNGENDILHNSTSPVFQFNMNPSLPGQMTSNISPTSNSLANTTNPAPPTTSVNNIPETNNNLFPGSDIVDLNDINPPLKENTINDVIMTPINTTAQTTPTSTPAGVPNKNNMPVSTTTTSKKSNSTQKAASNNNPLNNPIVEISKLIPVTGERPRPVENKSQIDDDVLFAVFIIMYEMDPEQHGMTVKQLCDYLLVRHPEMSNLSTKLSNLISAKLNAYVKKIEKGEKTLTYAISREWSAASPRRMLYIYRGLLAPDYKEQAHLVASKLKKQLAANIITTSTDKATNNNKTSKKNSNNTTGVAVNNIPQNIDLTSFDNSSFNLRQINSLNFTFPPEFNIPYSTSPVSATLNNTSHEDNNNMIDGSLINNENINSNKIMKSNKKNGSRKRANNDMTTVKTTTTTTKKNSKYNNNNNDNNNDDDNDSMKPPNKRQKSSNTESSNNSSSSMLINQSTPLGSQSTATINNSNNNDMNNVFNTHSNSYNAESNYITAVAAAPRISKYLPRSKFATPNNSSSNIHQLLTLHTPILKSGSQSKSGDKDDNTTTATFDGSNDFGRSNLYDEENQEQKNKEEYWINMVRGGFLTRDIDKPESISIEDLDNMF